MGSMLMALSWWFVGMFSVPVALIRYSPSS